MSTPTAAELAAFREAFMRFDTDASGHLDRQELEVMMTTLGAQMSSAEVADMFREADLDRDGRISLEEFLDAMAAP